ncbi:MAG: PIG-L family deacetylase [Planctomycetota bacterium]|nr:PIG-L family deacetylase [Planctomycetota bacterium]
MASVVVVGPHPDDHEIGMGGTIALLAAQGHSVLLLDVTDGEPTPMGTREKRLVEAAEAARILSAPGNAVRRHLLDLPNRSVEHTLAARHAFAGVYRAVQADILFVPHHEDAHPDHRAVTRIAEDARFDAKLTKINMPGDQGMPPKYPKWLFYYYCSHLRRPADPNFVIDTTPHAAQKRDAILAYRTQFIDNAKNHGVVEWLDAMGTYFGSRIGTKAGEPFFAKEPLGLSSFAGLTL